MNRKNKTIGLLLLLLLVVLISVGYALLTTDLTINGTSTIQKQNWDVEFDSLTTSGTSTVDGTVTLGASNADVTVTGPTVSTGTSTNDTITFTASFKKPGDSYSFEVDVHNKGTLKALATLTTEMTPTTYGTSPNQISVADYLSWTVTPTTAALTTSGVTLNATGTEKVLVTVAYKSTVTAAQVDALNAALEAQSNTTGLEVTLTATVHNEQTN